MIANEIRADVGDADRPITYAEAAELIAQSIASLRVYVAESDITEAQEAVKAIVEKSTF